MKEKFLLDEYFLEILTFWKLHPAEGCVPMQEVLENRTELSYGCVCLESFDQYIGVSCETFVETDVSRTAQRKTNCFSFVTQIDMKAGEFQEKETLRALKGRAFYHCSTCNEHQRSTNYRQKGHVAEAVDFTIELDSYSVTMEEKAVFGDRQVSDKLRPRSFSLEKIKEDKTIDISITPTRLI